MMLLKRYPEGTREHVTMLRQILIKASDDYREGIDLPPIAIAGLFASLAGQVLVGMEEEITHENATRFVMANALAGMGLPDLANATLDGTLEQELDKDDGV